MTARAVVASPLSRGRSSFGIPGSVEQPGGRLGRGGPGWWLRASCGWHLLRALDDAGPDLPPEVVRASLPEIAGRGGAAAHPGDRPPYWVLVRRSCGRGVAALTRLRIRAEHRHPGRGPAGSQLRRRR